MEECYKALNDQLDWNNPEGDRYPFNLSKPLPLVQSRNHQIILVDYFFNNDLTYLQRGSTVVTNVKVNIWYGYGHLKEIEVRRSNQQLYKFMEDDFLRLHLNDIEDMLLLKRVEDLQLGVESYQKNLNIFRPLMYKAGITDLEPYTTYSNPQCVIYLDKHAQQLGDEVYKCHAKKKMENLDKKRSRIMVKNINRQLLERRLMRSLEKFVGGREYEEDLRLLQRTI
ncbi:hypothetical protein Tco_0287375 [Tanacetum coccineum]